MKQTIRDIIDDCAEAFPMEHQGLSPIEGRVALVDGDYLAYYCMGDDECSAGEARGHLRTVIQFLQSEVRAEEMRLLLTDEGSSKGDRFLVATKKPYQGNRRKKQKTERTMYLREFMRGNANLMGCSVEVAENVEADDLGAHLALTLHQDMKDPVIITRDKDWRMIPALHYVWETGEIHDARQNRFVSYDSLGNLYGRKFFWKQMLTGDKADNIPGLPKVKSKGKYVSVGEKMADFLLADVHNPSSAFSLVLGLYRDVFGENAPQAFVEQAALLWMRGLHEELFCFADELRIHDDIDIHRGILAVMDTVEKRRKLLNDLYGV